MQLWNALSEVPADFGATAVTIGKYDAIHLGHTFLLNKLNAAASQRAIRSVVVTFNQHPLEVLQPGKAPLPILGPTQKLHRLEECGVDAVLNLDFTPELAAMSPEQFVQHILVDALHAEVVMVGEGFRFGAGAKGDCGTLAGLAQQHGFGFEAVARYVLDGEVVSTSAIRNALDAGDISQAAKLLGRPHLTTGTVEHGLKIGRTIGFPTANISRDAEGYLPLDAVYAGWMHVDGEKLPTAISIGINETFQAVPRLAEAFVIDRTGLDLYDKLVTLEYVQFIRPAAKFTGVEDLVAEINRDIEKIRTVLEI
jgi:riboflavin kinase/FMN adenylyltransferase